MARTRPTFAELLVAFDENPTDPPETEATEPVEFVIPEDLSSVPDADLAALHEQAVANFNAVYGDGKSITDDDLAALGTLTEGIEAITGEIATREASAAERAAAAAELAARAQPAATEQPAEDEPEQEETPEVPADAPETPEVPAVEPETPNGTPAPVERQREAVAASATPPRREFRVNMGALARRQPTPAPERTEQHTGPQTMRDVVLASSDGIGGFQQGAGLDWRDVGAIVDTRLRQYNAAQYEAAARSGKPLRAQYSIATLTKPFDPRLVINSTDLEHVDSVLQHAVDEHRLPGNSLVASGGWCAPSETLYDLCEIESRDGLISIPEVGISRGGIKHTPGPDFADIYANSGFAYTEQDDIDGDYDGAGGGSKPCYHVTCPDFTDDRLAQAGVCITAGLLQARGYPEVIARTVRGALVAHDHKMSARVIAAIQAGSTAVTMPAATPGVAAPLLNAVALQVEHIKASTRIARSTTIQLTFPFWVREAFRNDLARRDGVNLLDVSDAQIDSWFAVRGAVAQFVYNFQDINTTPAASFTAWPETVTFLAHAAGAWVKGGSEIITIDTLYDSTLLGTNDYTALFTEEGWLVSKRCHDSRAVTVAICGDGSTGDRVGFACDGTVVPTP